MKNTLAIVLGLFLALGFSTVTCAKDTKVVKTGVEAKIIAELKKKLPATKVTSVTKAPMGNLYEVVMGPNIAYVDPEAKYFMFGHIFDISSQQDLTQNRLELLTKVKFSKLPLDKAIKVVKGNGGDNKRVFAVFTDPNCGYCRQLEVNLKDVDNYTMYVFLYPLQPGAREKAEQIWCDADRAAAFHKAMVDGLPEQAGSAKKCDVSQIDSFLTLGESLNVQGTPTLFHQDGRHSPGTMPTEVLDQWLSGRVK